jgi:glutathione S-transferase
MSITLFGSLQSGHSFKPRLLMLLAGISHRYVAIDISQPREQRPEDFQQVAPYGEVPVLLQDGVVLAQSNAILLHLARQFGVFGANDATGWNAITQWLFWEANRIGRSFPNLRWCRRFGPASDPGLVAWFEATAIADLGRLNAELASRPFLLDEPTIADFSCAGYLIYGDAHACGIDLGQWPHVVLWLDRIRALPGFVSPQNCMEHSDV